MSLAIPRKGAKGASEISYPKIFLEIKKKKKKISWANSVDLVLFGESGSSE